MKAGFILVAAGEGRRLGSALPKAFVDLAGRSMLVRSFEAMQACPQLTFAAVVVPGSRRDEAHGSVAAVCREGLTFAIAAGGKERQDSVAAGLAALPADIEIILVHDAARPFVRPDVVARCLEAAISHGAATVALPATDTVKEVDARGVVVRTLERQGLRMIQTPQAFRVSLLTAAHDRARREGWTGTDDAALVELCGAAVWTVLGDPENRKVTTPEDLEWARWRLEAEPR